MKGFIVDAGSASELDDTDIGILLVVCIAFAIGAFGYGAYLFLTINMGVVI